MTSEKSQNETQVESSSESTKGSERKIGEVEKKVKQTEESVDTAGGHDSGHDVGVKRIIVGVSSLFVASVFVALAQWLPNESRRIEFWITGSACVVGVFGIFWICMGARKTKSLTPGENPFMRYTFTIGLVMLITGFCGLVGVSGLVRSGELCVCELARNAKRDIKQAEQEHREAQATFDLSKQSVDRAWDHITLLQQVYGREDENEDCEVSDSSELSFDAEVKGSGRSKCSRIEQFSGAFLDEGGNTELKMQNAIEQVVGAERQMEAARKSLALKIQEHTNKAFAGEREFREHSNMIFLAGILSIIGALFFVTNTLWRKRESKEGMQPSQFDPGSFWAGLVLRTGEAVMFVLVFVLLGVASIELEVEWFPIIGLVFGMFVKSGEQVVFGIAHKVFEAANALVPFGSGAPK